MSATPASTDFELRQSVERQNARSDAEDGLPAEVQSFMADQALGQVDGGFSAWRLLCVAFVFEAILWGFPLSFGVFQSYYSQLPQFQNSPFVTYIGTIATGITYLGAPLTGPLAKRLPKFQRLMILVGWILCMSGLVAASFANTVSSLVATQGVMYGVGYLFIIFPVINMMNEWWVARRGFAWGVLAASSGVAGVAYPFIIQSLLQTYGYKTTLRALAVGTGALTGPLLPLLKGRLPASHSSALVRTDWSFFKKPLFWLYAVSTVTQSLGFYLPSLYLPSYAASIGLSPKYGAMLVALMSFAQVPGQLTYGHLSDGRFFGGRLSLNILVLSTCVIAAMSSLTLWGLAKSLVPLIFFSLIYGFFAYSYTAMRVRMGSAVADQSAALATFCVFSFIQGIGNVLVGPISGILLSPAVNSHDYGYQRYKSLIIFTGCSMVASAASVALSAYLRHSKKIT